MFYNKSNCTITMLQYCASRVLAMCSTIAATVLWFRESFFFFSFLFFLLNIDVSWHLYCYINTTNFTIFSQLLTCQFLTSQNKIWDCSQPQMKINVLKKCYNTYCYHNIFIIVEISVSYISKKKILNQQHFNINFTTNHK